MLENNDAEAVVFRKLRRLCGMSLFISGVTRAVNVLLFDCSVRHNFEFAHANSYYFCRFSKVVMAYRNKVIFNSKTKQEIRFLQTAKDTNGELLEIESTYNPHSKEPIAHFHPNQAEDFTVIAGELTIRFQGNVSVLKAGEAIHIPKNAIHSMWNNSNEKTVVNWKVRPALETEYFLETATGLANEGKTNDVGTPNILQVSLLAGKYANVFRLSKPPFAIQRIVFAILSPFARLRGYRPTYSKYLD